MVGSTNLCGSPCGSPVARPVVRRRSGENRASGHRLAPSLPSDLRRLGATANAVHPDRLRGDIRFENGTVAKEAIVRRENPSPVVGVASIHFHRAQLSDPQHRSCRVDSSNEESARISDNSRWQPLHFDGVGVRSACDLLLAAGSDFGPAPGRSAIRHGSHPVPGRLKEVRDLAASCRPG